MPLYLTERLSTPITKPTDLMLALTAEERTRSRHYFETTAGEGVSLHLPRGTVLRHGDVLRSEDGKTLVQIVAKPEPVMTVRAATPLDLLRAAYHLGNRHVPLEVRETYLRFSPDRVLQSMLAQMGVQITEEILPFEPESGAYSHSANHTHTHVHAHTHTHTYSD